MLLHHYPISPYAEKVRLMLGYLNFEWQSVIHKPVPPRDTLDKLTGGYRRIPVLQIGADIFCDTRTIVDELAKQTSRAELSYSHCDNEIRAFCNYAEGTAFMPIIGSAEKLTTLKVLLSQYWPWQIIALMKDRQAVTSNAKIKLHGFKKRQEIIADFKSRFSEQLANQSFLFGDQPSLADFSAYHLTWFANKTQSKKFFHTGSTEQAWLKRMESFGHTKGVKTKKAEALRVATLNTPREIEAEFTQHKWQHRQISIAPNDYATDAVKGELVGANEMRWIVKVMADKDLVTYVHFPTTGFDVALLD